MRTTVPLLALVALVSAADVQLLSQPVQAPGRKLLQPFTLNLPKLTRYSSSNTGRIRAGQLSALNNAALTQIDTDSDVDEAIVTRATQDVASSNLNMGGLAKGTFQATTENDRTAGRTDTAADARSIGQPGSGRTASKLNDVSLSLAQNRIQDAGTPPGPDNRFEGPTDDQQLGAWEVLTATARDYGFAGDYDYTLVNALIEDATGTVDASQYDDEYDAQPQPVPESAVVTGRTSTNVRREDGAGPETGLGGLDRAAASARAAQIATAADAIARGFTRTAGLHGVTRARANDDLFGKDPVFVPANPFSQYGAGSAGVGRGTSNKNGLRPSVVVNTGTAGTTVGTKYIAGGVSDALTYVGGTQDSNARSKTLAFGGNENIDIQFGRRRHAAQRKQ